MDGKGLPYLEKSSLVEKAPDILDLYMVSLALTNLALTTERSSHNFRSGLKYVPSRIYSC